MACQSNQISLSLPRCLSPPLSLSRCLVLSCLVLSFEGDITFTYKKSSPFARTYLWQTGSSVASCLWQTGLHTRWLCVLLATTSSDASMFMAIGCCTIQHLRLRRINENKCVYCLQPRSSGRATRNLRAEKDLGCRATHI